MIWSSVTCSVFRGPAPPSTGCRRPARHRLPPRPALGQREIVCGQHADLASFALQGRESRDSHSLRLVGHGIRSLQKKVKIRTIPALLRSAVEVASWPASPSPRRARSGIAQPARQTASRIQRAASKKTPRSEKPRQTGCPGPRSDINGSNTLSVCHRFMRRGSGSPTTYHPGRGTATRSARGCHPVADRQGAHYNLRFFATTKRDHQRKSTRRE